MLLRLASQIFTSELGKGLDQLGVKLGIGTAPQLLERFF
jgi:hypothetical protein